MCPASGRYSPARMLIRVDLPAPFSPRRAWTSPQRAEKSTCVLATTPGKALSMPTISTAHRSAAISRLWNIADDVAERPVHLVRLDVRVFSGLACFGRAFEKVAKRLSLGRFHVPVVINQWSLPDVERPGLDLRRHGHRWRGHIRGYEARRLRRFHQPVFHVVV